MLMLFLSWLESFAHGFQVLNYVTVRAIFAALTSLMIVLLTGPAIINYLAVKQIGQVVRDYGPNTHLSKKGTPTMGGVLILLAIAISSLIWCKLDNGYIWVTLLTTLGFGVIGWYDDFKKLILKDPKGLAAKWKYFFQSVLGAVAAVWLYQNATPAETELLFPFFKNLSLQLGIFYVVLTYFVIVGTSNAVNLTDGLDGLAILPIVIVGGALGIFAYLTGHLEFSSYLNIIHIKGTAEIVIFCSALVGAGLGFLWFNTYPAQIFMGDVGALGLGAALGTVAVIVRQELVLFIMGGVFVAETLSVILQVASFKLRGKRIFKMAPIHHHFELVGWPEPKVIVRFWIITVVLTLIGLATIKIR